LIHIVITGSYCDRSSEIFPPPCLLHRRDLQVCAVFTYTVWMYGIWVVWLITATDHNWPQRGRNRPYVKKLNLIAVFCCPVLIRCGQLSLVVVLCSWNGQGLSTCPRIIAF